MKNFLFGGFDFIFNFFPVIFIIVFILVTGIIITQLIKGAAQWNKNNNSPILTVEAKIIAKRTDIRRNIHHHRGAGTHHHHHHTASSSSTYYITFEVESGDRMELQIFPQEYGLLVEGDSGMLTFQGTRFKSFERKK